MIILLALVNRWKTLAVSKDGFLLQILQPHMQTANDRPIRMYGVIPIFVEDPSSHLSPMIQMPKEIEPLQIRRTIVH